MSEIRVNNITNRDGSTGTTVAGIPVVDSNSHFVVPTGRTGTRYADGGENIVRDGLVLHLDAKYSYPGATGTNPDVYTLYDMSGNGNDGELINGVSYSGTNGGSLVFDEVNNIVMVPNSPSYNNNSSKTVEMWVKAAPQVGADQDSGSGRFEILATTRQYGDEDINFALAYDNRALVRFHNPSGTDRMVLIYTIGNGTNAFTAFSKEKLGTGDSGGDNVWHQVVGITNVKTQTIQLYYDGALVDSNTFSGSPYIGTVPMRIGGSYTYENTTDYPFGGNIAITRIYNKALSASEVLQNYNALKGRFGL